MNRLVQYRLDVWSYEAGEWAPLAYYREIDWAALDRKARETYDGKVELQLVNVKTGDVVAEWGDGKRLPGLKGAMAR